MKYVLFKLAYTHVNIIGINVRDSKQLNSLKYQSNHLYIVSADFSHQQTFSNRTSIENCATHSILFDFR